MKKFVILSSQRSGSNYLMSLLHSHPEIFVGGEIFRKKNQFLNNYLSINNVKYEDIDPEEYIKAFFSKNLKDKANCIGFRLFYNHGSNKKQVIWNTMKIIPDIRFIHLQRKNMLKKLLSLKLAKKTSSWLRKKMEPERIYKPVYLDYQECLRYFRQQEQNIQDATHFFRNNKIKNIFYEDLVADEHSETNKLQTFLELKPEILKGKFMKQNMQGLSEIISNYFDLKNKFKNTDWEVFFET